MLFLCFFFPHFIFIYSNKYTPINNRSPITLSLLKLINYIKRVSLNCHLAWTCFPFFFFEASYISVLYFTSSIALKFLKFSGIGPRRWNKTIGENKTNWGKIFRSARKVYKENKLREFHFKFMHSVVVTKTELFRFIIKPDRNVRLLRGIRLHRSYLYLVPVHKILYSISITMV